jgi:transposase
MIPVPSGVRVWLAVSHTDMRRSMNGLALQVLGRDPHAGDLYVFRGRRGDLVKIVWHDGLGMSHHCSQNLCKGERVRGCGGRERFGARGFGALDDEAPRWRRARATPCPPGGISRQRSAGG